jgi:ribosomal protein L11 methyltransferase
LNPLAVSGEEEKCAGGETVQERRLGALPSGGRVCNTVGVPARWLELTIRAPSAYADLIANFLIERGAPGLELREESGFVSLVAHFAIAAPLTELEDYCASLGWHPRTGADLHLRTIDDQDWAHTWKQHVRSQAVGETLYICPSWETRHPAERLAVIIDPGMAFGTGQHASTRGCLILLESTVRCRSVGHALDLGTGSGILAITLAKMGVRDVWAIDVDAVACAAARRNVDINGVGRLVHVADSWPVAPRRFDLVVANLYADLLEELAARLSGALSACGTLVCSGFLTADAARIAAVYGEQGLTPTLRHEEEGWVTLGLTRS